MLIIVYHINSKIADIETVDGLKIEFNINISIAKALTLLAKKYPDSKIVWCDWNYKEALNVKEINNLCHHDKLMLSFCPGTTNYFDERLGYVDESLFIKVNKKVSFPTWQMSSIVGVIQASILIEISNKISFNSNLSYYLSSLSKLCMPLGLLCYSEPKLLKENKTSFVTKNSNYILFRFVKQHYKLRWVFLLFFNITLYERKSLFLPFLVSFFYAKRNNSTINLEEIKVKSNRKIVDNKTIDVIIPTIGRKKYLYDVLWDLSKQTLLPTSVIIVEQNPNADSKSELNFLYSESWPFQVKHTFTHQAGACNARNLALNLVLSEWVFLADDDNRFESNLLEEIFSKIEQYGNGSVTTSYPQKSEANLNRNVIQSLTFGAGNSFVKNEFLNRVKFNMGYEFGYGEDNDFGMQLRNQGIDVLYLPKPQILHLKAPMGGFRIKPTLKWQNDEILPKPSPTIMLYQIMHNSRQQVLGYKTILFFKYYKHQEIKNPIRYFVNFKKQWHQSTFWAKKLKE
jgi:GT2 family glycosyltransferase